MTRVQPLATAESRPVPRAATPLLVVDGLAKTFLLHLLGGRRVLSLQPVSFTVAEGEFVAVIGASGSGKSTLLKCLYRTYRVSAGRANFRTVTGDIVDLACASDTEIMALRSRLGELSYVSQFLRPTPRVTALDLVAEPLVARGLPREEARRHAALMLRRLEVPADLHDGFPVLFSGGEQQRVNVARSLIVLPRLLLLDEPTSALDPVNQRMVTALLREAKLGGTTIVAVLHDLELVRRLADRYLLLHQGQLVDEGPASSAALAGNVVR